jgi:hypothetical protein
MVVQNCGSPGSGELQTWVGLGDGLGDGVGGRSSGRVVMPSGVPERSMRPASASYSYR